MFSACNEGAVMKRFRAQLAATTALHGILVGLASSKATMQALDNTAIHERIVNPTLDTALVCRAVKNCWNHVILQAITLTIALLQFALMCCQG